MTLKEKYIDHVLDGCDMDDLLDMARCHLEDSLPDDEEQMKQHCFDLGLDYLVEDEYIDGNGRRQKSGQCARCGTPLGPNDYQRFNTVSELVCESCDN